ncbi:type IV secretion system protein [Pseudoalteromonas nigrifaciens]|uniref:type IV secretion system protein n=1 Tax=Pseudoalteromonas nigrifaciens TaxID=28109 RepID=UPI003FD4066F
MMKKKLLILLLLILPVVFIFNDVSANADQIETHAPTISENFKNELAIKVDMMLHDEGSGVYKMNSIVIRALYFIVLFTAVVRYIAYGVTLEGTIPPVFVAFILGILSETYFVWTDGIYQFFNYMGLSIQETVVGTDSPYYLSTYMNALWDRINFQPIDIFDSVEYVVLFFVVFIMQMILQVVVAIAEVYAEFGVALAQIIGPVFLVFILHPATRGIFDKWLGVLIGFGAFSFIIKAVGVIYSLYTMSLIDKFNSKETIDGTIMINPSSDQEIIVSLIINSVVGILFVVGAAKISSAIAGGVGGGNFSNTAMKAGTGLAKKAATAALL